MEKQFTGWRKSSLSGGNEGCLFVASANDGSGDIGLAERASADGVGAPDVVVPRASWVAFVAGVRAGEFDHI